MARLHHVAVLGGMLLGASTGFAQDRAQFVPSRDVVVTYETAFADMPRDVMAYHAATRTFRAQHEGAQGYALMDVARLMQTEVSTRHRAWTSHPVEVQPWNPSIRLEQGASDTVLGTECRIWSRPLEEVPNLGRVGGQAWCVSADGIVLWFGGISSSGRVNRAATAVTVSRDAQDASRFQVPRGYRQLAPRQFVALR
jgi:hypothetical protein